VLDQLEDPPLDARRLPRGLRQELRRCCDALDAEREHEPLLSRAKIEFTVVEDSVRLRVGTLLDLEQVAALQRVVAKLQRQGVVPGR
jgi:hypothetical protein